MLAKTLRLDFISEYKILKANGRWLRGYLFDILFVSNPQNKGIKIAIIITKKVSSLSVGRHLLKRQLSEAILKQKTQIPDGTKMIIFAKKEIYGKKFSEIAREMSRVIKTIKR